MADETDGLVNSDLPRDKNQSAVNVGHHIQVEDEALTGASGAGDTFAITVPAGAMEVKLYVLDSSNALLPFTIDDIQDTPDTALWPTALGAAIFGCSGHTTIAGSVATGDLADAATGTAVCIFTMGKGR